MSWMGSAEIMCSLLLHKLKMSTAATWLKDFCLKNFENLSLPSCSKEVVEVLGMS